MSTQAVNFENRDKSTPTLESVKLDFLNWRSDPHGSNRIPEYLWDSVISLLSQHSKNKVLSSLGISSFQLTKKLKDRGQISAVVSQPLNFSALTTANKKFVKTIVAAPAPITTCYDVLLTKSNGTTLQIQSLSHHDVLKLTELFAG